MMSNMNARLIARDRFPVDVGSFVEMVIWEIPQPLRGCSHRYKYRFAYVENDVCVVRFDNETGKGDHKHIDRHEFPIIFVSINQLYDDFYKEVDQWRMTR